MTVYLVAFYAYPLYRNLDLSLRDYTVRSFVQGGAPFIGLDNYRTVFDDPTFVPGAAAHRGVHRWCRWPSSSPSGWRWRCSSHQHFRLSATLRALFLVPWLLPLIVSASTWSWMLNSDSGVVNAALRRRSASPRSTGSPRRSWSLASVIIANIWIGIPFNLVVLYSGLQAIPGRPVRGGRARRRDRLAAVLAGHLPAAAPGLRDHPAARPGLHAQGLRHHLDHDQGRPGRLLHHASPPGPTGSASATCCPRSAPAPRSATC